MGNFVRAGGALVALAIFGFAGVDPVWAQSRPGISVSIGQAFVFENGSNTFTVTITDNNVSQGGAPAA